jgi:hypothetical protein
LAIAFDRIEWMKTSAVAISALSASLLGAQIQDDTALSAVDVDEHPGPRCRPDGDVAGDVVRAVRS